MRVTPAQKKRGQLLCGPFCHALHRVRYQSGQRSYGDAAEVSDFSRSTLHRVQSVHDLIPQARATIDFVRSFNGDVEWFREQYRVLGRGVERNLGIKPYFYPTRTVVFSVQAFGSTADLALDMARLLRERGQTQIGLAKRSGVSNTTFSDLCSAKSGHVPTANTLTTFLRMLDVEEGDINTMMEAREELEKKRHLPPPCDCYPSKR